MRTNPRTLLVAVATGLTIMFSAGACVAGSATGSVTGPGAGASSAPPEPINASPIACEASGPELLGLLEGDKTNYDKAGDPTEFSAPVCVDKYALVKVTKTKAAGTEHATILFSYDVTENKWSVVNMGTQGVCTGKVPDAVASALGC